MFPNIGSGMLGLELPLHQPQQQKQQNPTNAQNPHHLHQHPQMISYTHNDPDHHPSQSQQSLKYPFASKAKQPISLSDEDDPDNNSGDAKRKTSPWQRMKWTDTMVRLLIMAVYYIGDEAGTEGTDPKKKSSGLLQKKGKWKSVSRAMMEKGFYVSPQQCEDKFNDLNKRYKRVNDILGKGTACKVVENQNLLDTMDLAPKMKEEVRKLLNSKHLFFREMCAYHNSCGHGVVANQSPETGIGIATEPSSQNVQNHHQQAQQQGRCFHSSENNNAGGVGASLTEGSKIEEEEDDEDDEDDSDEDEDEDEESEHGLQHEDNEDDNEERCSSRKRARKGVMFNGSNGFNGSPSQSQLIQQLRCELNSLVQDGAKSPWDKKQWMRTRLMQLEEQQVMYQCQAFELEKQRLKWVKFSSKKEREMDRAKLENERRRLENERMVLVVRQKEIELLDLQHQQHQQQHSSNKRGEPSSVTG